MPQESLLTADMNPRITRSTPSPRTYITSTPFLTNIIALATPWPVKISPARGIRNRNGVVYHTQKTGRVETHQKLGNMRGASVTKTTTFHARHASTTSRKAALSFSGMLAKPMLTSRHAPSTTASDTRRGQPSWTRETVQAVQHKDKTPIPVARSFQTSLRQQSTAPNKSFVHISPARLPFSWGCACRIRQDVDPAKGHDSGGT